jgi:hypothetical protein
MPDVNAEQHLVMLMLPSLARIAGAALLCCVAACAGLRHRAEVEDVSRAVGPPPGSWKAGIGFYLQDSTRVEFFDGLRTRVVTAQEGMESAQGRTPWYRVHLADTLATVLHVKVTFPGLGEATAEYPLIVQRDAFYGVWIGVAGYDPRYVISAREPRSYPIPAAVQKMPSDSLRIFWGAHTRDCWSCPN